MTPKTKTSPKSCLMMRSACGSAPFYLCQHLETAPCPCCGCGCGCGHGVHVFADRHGAAMETCGVVATYGVPASVTCRVHRKNASAVVSTEPCYLLSLASRTHATRTCAIGKEACLRLLTVEPYATPT